MLLTPSENYSRGTIKRMRRNGRQYDIVLDCYINNRPAPFGLLCKSHKNGKYVWFNRKTVAVPRYERYNVPKFDEDIVQYTSSYDLFDEYLDCLIKKMPKKGKEKYVIIKKFYKKSGSSSCHTV